MTLNGILKRTTMSYNNVDESHKHNLEDVE